MNYDTLKLKLNQTIDTLFANKKISRLSQYEKRKTIFNYLCKSLKYDSPLLEKIKNAKTIKISRNPRNEFLSVVNNNIGICSAISQYYKLILEQVGIKSYCVICDDGTPVNHELVLVYDADHDTYSFDDITSVIVNLGSEQDYFDYDLESAHLKNQGNKKVMGDDEFFILPEDFINYVANRNPSFVFCESKTTIPLNIASVKYIKDSSSIKTI